MGGPQGAWHRYDLLRVSGSRISVFNAAVFFLYTGSDEAERKFAHMIDTTEPPPQAS